MIIEETKKFMSFFRGNERSYGKFITNNKMVTERKVVTEAEFQKHIDGIEGVGIVPILDDGTCFFGVVDVDCHDKDESIDLLKIEETSKEFDLPVVICRSKSGGAHIYMFFKDAIDASIVRFLLKKVAQVIGYPKAEIFPKQDKLFTDSEGNRQLGSWINLPYFDAAETVRYCIDNGKERTLEYFIELCQSRMLDSAQVTTFMSKFEETIDFDDAPPCIQKLIKDGVPYGQRNLSLFNVGIFLKKKFPKEWKEKLHNVNNAGDSPLPYSEVNTLVQSINKSKYNYKCKEDPIHSLCNSEICIKRKYGIEAENQDITKNMPMFSNIKKYMTDPVKWSIDIDGKTIYVSTATLLDFRAMRAEITETLMKVMPLIKHDVWVKILQPLMENAIIIEAPAEASPLGYLVVRLHEFLRKTDLSDSGDDVAKRKLVLRGSPVVQNIGGFRAVYFRGQDFRDYLKKTKSDDYKPCDLWIKLKDAGVKHSRLRVDAGNTINIWYMELDGSNIITPDYGIFKAPVEF